MNTFVRKVTSWNPTEYKFVRLETALGNYESYIVSVIESGITTKSIIPRLLMLGLKRRYEYENKTNVR